MSTKRSPLGKRTAPRNIQDDVHEKKKARTHSEYLSYTQQCEFCVLVWDKDADFRRKMKPSLKKWWNPLNKAETIQLWNESGLMGRKLLKVPTFKMKDARAIFVKLVRENTPLRFSILNTEHFAPLLRSFKSATGARAAVATAAAAAEFKFVAPSFDPFSANPGKTAAEAGAEEPTTNPKKATAEEPATTTQDPKFSDRQIVKWEKTGNTSYAILGCMRQGEQWKYRIYADAGLIYVPEKELDVWST